MYEQAKQSERRGIDVVPTHSSIPFMEPSLSAATSVPFSSLLSDSDDTVSEGVAQLKDILSTYGFAVVTDVIDASTVQQLQADFAKDLLSIIEVPEGTAPSKELAALLADPIGQWPLGELDLGAKFVSYYGLTQGDCAWNARLHPNVKKTFAVIFGTNDLVVGCDNVFFNNVKCDLTEEEKQSELWPHADQNYTVTPSGRYNIYQGVLYLWPTSPATSSTVVWPGSNNAEYSSLSFPSKNHFCRLAKSRYSAFAQEARRVAVPSGGLLLWSSKTIHQGWNYGERLAIPMCYEPSWRRGEQALESKKNCVLNGYPTTHWASLGIRHPLALTMPKSTSVQVGNCSVVLEARGQRNAVDARGTIRPDILNVL